MDVPEEELLEAIRRALSGSAEPVRVGVGDDAAVVAPGTGELVLTTDALVERTHFDLDTWSARDLGYKAVAVNVSDIAAMAASPRYALAALTLSDRVDAAFVMELIGGMRECADEHALWIVGGNLSRGTDVVVVVTIVGEVAPGRAVRRDGAGAGDVVVVTGSLGAAALGLRSMTRRGNWSDDERTAIRHLMRPTARVGEAAILARSGATAMIDISDGLGIDLRRLTRSSGVAASIRLADVPVAPAASLDEAIGGGEDYELLATMPSIEAADAARRDIAETFGIALTPIGWIADGDGVTAIGADGTERPLEPAGWDHFA
ncbi:MAG TPA: thiamine-phosphate kinase [Actinomycetota bacterium]|jgi:thiamine-monophosphate kinase